VAGQHRQGVAQRLRDLKTGRRTNAAGTRSSATRARSDGDVQGIAVYPEPLDEPPAFPPARPRASLRAP
jgi:cytochrome c553